jgi:cyclic pyranopterin phosphate synthase
MPEEGVQWLNPEDILSFEEIADVVRSATLMGINKIRLTGGEPLVRKDIIRLVGKRPGTDNKRYSAQ